MLALAVAARTRLAPAILTKNSASLQIHVSFLDATNSALSRCSPRAGLRLQQFPFVRSVRLQATVTVRLKPGTPYHEKHRGDLSMVLRRVMFVTCLAVLVSSVAAGVRAKALVPAGHTAQIRTSNPSPLE
jgi:hypothetical protein